MIPTIEKMLPKLDSILTSVNTLVADPAIAGSLHNIQRITTDLTASTRELNTLMAGFNRQVPGLMTKANGVLDNASQLTGNLGALDVAGTMAKVDATLANMQQLSEALNNNQGTLGLLMKDRQLYNKLNQTMESANALLSDFKAHPKRYIHFSVFGKKDK
jgi:phospholipid/cholesterol/gamma-HCH transport system substrate-binding protein